MANICENRVTIMAPAWQAGQLKDLRKRINDQDPALISEDLCGHLSSTSCGNIAYGLESDLPLEGDGTINLLITSKWRFPEDDFAKLSGEYPSLTINVAYEESGNGNFGTMKFQNGTKVMHQQMDALEYYTENNEEFAEELENINDSTYKEFKKSYILDQDFRDEVIWERYGYLLEPILLNRVSDKDLPLLIDTLKYCNDELLRRLSKSPK